MAKVFGHLALSEKRIWKKLQKFQTSGNPEILQGRKRRKKWGSSAYSWVFPWRPRSLAVRPLHSIAFFCKDCQLPNMQSVIFRKRGDLIKPCHCFLRFALRYNKCKNGKKTNGGGERRQKCCKFQKIDFSAKRGPLIGKVNLHPRVLPLRNPGLGIATLFQTTRTIHMHNWAKSSLASVSSGHHKMEN